VEKWYDKYKKKSGDRRSIETAMSMLRHGVLRESVRDGFVLMDVQGECLFIYGVCGNGEVLSRWITDTAKENKCKFVYARAAKGGKLLHRYLKMCTKFKPTIIRNGEGIMWEVDYG